MKITLSKDELRRLIKSPVAGYEVVAMETNSYRSAGAYAEIELEPAGERPIAIRPAPERVVDAEYPEVRPAPLSVDEDIPL